MTTTPRYEAMRAKLVAHQDAHLLSDTAMARQLGIHRNSWRQIRTGAAALGPKVALGALARWPELLADLAP